MTLVITLLVCERYLSVILQTLHQVVRTLLEPCEAMHSDFLITLFLYHVIKKAQEEIDCYRPKKDGIVLIRGG